MSGIAEKRRSPHEVLVGICRFWAVVLPIFLCWGVASWLTPYRQIPAYHQDCTAAQTNLVQSVAPGPCVYQAATATLKDYYHSGRRDNQDVLFDFPDGQADKMEIDGPFGTWWRHSQVDGPCYVERWQGVITAVFKGGMRINSQKNPELRGGPTGLYLICFLGAMMLGIWGYLIVLWKKGEL